MTATPFNPLAPARELEAAGIERRPAEAISGPEIAGEWR